MYNNPHAYHFPSIHAVLAGVCLGRESSEAAVVRLQRTKNRETASNRGTTGCGGHHLRVPTESRGNAVVAGDWLHCPIGEYDGGWKHRGGGHKWDTAFSNWPAMEGDRANGFGKAIESIEKNADKNFPFECIMSNKILFSSNNRKAAFFSTVKECCRKILAAPAATKEKITAMAPG